MKRISIEQLRSEAAKIKRLWIMHYGQRNADKLSLAVRKAFREKKNESKM